MAKRLYDKGSLFGVSIGADEISEFRDRWPASGLHDLRNLYAEFEKRSGDLVDLEANGRSGAGRFDGEALAALTNDMQCWAEASLGIDTGRGCSEKSDWREYLGPPKKPKAAKAAVHHAMKKSPSRAKPRKEIRRASVTTDYFRGQTYGDVEWEDGSVTSGPLNTHMRALLGRARREGKSVRHKTIGA